MNPKQSKNDENIKINTNKNNHDIILNLRKKSFIPLISYKKLNFHSSVINYFAIGICLFVNGCLNLEWFKSNYNEEFYVGYYLISGIVLYIVGILNWYEGKELVFLIDFIYSFYFIALFMIKYEIFKITDNDNDKLHGSFYVIFFCLIICITISSKNKGIWYTLNYIVLFIGYLFLFFFKYYDKKWIKDAYSYIFIISGALFWITGLLKIIDNDLAENSITILQPSD